MNALLAAAWRECRFWRQSPWDLALVSWIPCLLLVLCMWLLSSAVPRQLPVAVVDQDHSAASRALVRQLDAAPGLHITASPAELGEAWSLVRQMQVYALVYLPEGYARQIAQGQSATVFAYCNAALATAGQTAFREISTVVQAANAQVMLQDVAAVSGLQALRAPPVNVQATVLFNPGRNFEVFLGGLLLPALLHLMLCMTATSALCRELRDNTVEAWLAASGGSLPCAIIGKLLPYFLIFSLYGVQALLWITVVRGDGIAGSATALISGMLLMLAAYVAIALLIAGAARTMSQALSVVGLYAGTSLAFCGATFPVDGASWFARLWHQLLPFTTYVKLDAQQRYMPQADGVSALAYLAVLVLFIAVCGLAGYVLYRKAVNTPQRLGQR